MQTGCAEQLDVLLSQSTRVFDKSCNTEKTDISTTSARDKRSLLPFDNQDTQIEAIMAEKRGITSIISAQQLEITWIN